MSDRVLPFFGKSVNVHGKSDSVGFTEKVGLDQALKWDGFGKQREGEVIMSRETEVGMLCQR